MPSDAEIECHQIKTVQDLLPLLKPSQDETVSALYRGHRDARWELTPSLFRLSPPTLYQTWRLLELTLLDKFWRRSVALRVKPTDQAQQRAVAQHYGLPTRLLDWSKSPLVALAFGASEVKARGKNDEPDGVLWEIRTSSTWGKDLTLVDELEKKAHVAKYFPPAIDSRIVAQQGCFTIHSLPQKKAPFEALERRFTAGNTGLRLRRFDFTGDTKSTLRRELATLGLGPASLFPDLEGFAGAAIAETIPDWDWT